MGTPEGARFVYGLSGRQALNRYYELSAIVQVCSKGGFDITRMVERKGHPGLEEPHGNLQVCHAHGGQE